jgi:hypothetical protein
MAQVQAEAKEFSFKSAFAEYLKVNRDLASGIFLDLKRDVEYLINHIYAEDNEKNTAFYFLGMLVETFDQLDTSIQIAEEVGYYNEDVRNAIIAFIEVLLRAYADLKAGRPLSEVNDHLRDFIIIVNKTLREHITEIAKRIKDP